MHSRSKPCLLVSLAASFLSCGTPDDTTGAEGSDENGSAGDSSEGDASESEGAEASEGSDGAEEASTRSDTTDAEDSTAGESTSSSSSESEGGDASTSPATSAGEASDSEDSGGESEASDDSGNPGVEVCPGGPYAESPFEGISSPYAAERVSSSGELPLEVEGGGLAEGPVWVGDALLFTHFGGSGYQSEILRFTPPDQFELALPPDAGVNGLALDPEGALHGASHLVGGLVAIDLAAQEVTPVIDEYDGARLNSPNDLAIRHDGNIYFSDPQYQAPQPLPQGNVKRFFHYAPGTGMLAIVEEWSPEDNAAPNDPNGVALAPDGNTVYLGHGGGVNAYDLNADGTVVTPGMRLSGVNHPVDGMTVDCAGNIYATDHGAGRITVMSPDGTAIDTITVSGQLTNVAFGGPERTTLFATAGDPANGIPIYAIDLAIPGYPN